MSLFGTGDVPVAVGQKQRKISATGTSPVPMHSYINRNQDRHDGTFAQKSYLCAKIVYMKFSSALSQYLQKNQYNNFRLKAVFFDMDGVLYDSMKFHANAWTNAMLDLGIPFTLTEAYMNEGRTGHSTIDGVFGREFSRMATEEEKQDIYKLKTKYFESYGQTEVMPFAAEVLEQVQQQGLQISVVTGSAQASLIDNLENHFPGKFDREHMVTAFDVKQGKPFPEPYLKALKKSGFQPWEVVVVENAPLGVESAVAAGLFTIAVNTGPLDPQVLADSGADIVLPGGMEELNAVWSAFSGLAGDFVLGAGEVKEVREVIEDKEDIEEVA